MQCYNLVKIDCSNPIVHWTTLDPGQEGNSRFGIYSYGKQVWPLFYVFQTFYDEN